VPEPGVDPVRASFELLFEQSGCCGAIVGTINRAALARNVATVAGKSYVAARRRPRGQARGNDMPRTLMKEPEQLQPCRYTSKRLPKAELSRVSGGR
jgi:hypothetical protein